MRAMNDSGVSSFGLVPQNWSVLKLKSVLSLRCEKSGGVGELLSVYLNRGVIPYSESDGLQVHKPSENLSNYQVVYVGDFVLNNQQAWRGSVGVSRHKGIVSPAYFVYRLNELCYSYYMNYLLRDNSMVQQYETSSRGVGTIQRNIFAPWLLNSWIILPPLPEQQAIATFLDAKCAEIDALSADIQSEIETLEAYKRSVITEAVTKGLDKNAPMKDSGIEWIGEVPVHWKMIRGKYLFAQKSERGNAKSLVLLSPTQNYGVIPQELYEELSGFSAVKLNEKTDYSLLKTVHKGAFVISLRSFQGGFEYSTYEGVVSPAYQVFYPSTRAVDGYYKYLFKTDSFIEKMNSFTMSLRDGKNIAFGDFGRTYIPVPPIDEQKAIATFLDAKCAEIDSIIAQKQEQLAIIADYKKSLIYEYVTGKKEAPAL